MTFVAGQASAILMVSTTDDNITEMPEYFKLMIVSISMPSVVKPGDPNTSYITIQDNEPGGFNVPCVVMRPVSTVLFQFFNFDIDSKNFNRIIYPIS